jgi:hypothetical protein
LIRSISVALGILAALAAAPASAGPPYLTDDPEPTDTGHWEIYGPLVQSEGFGSDFSGSLGAEVNYGAAHNIQLTLDLPAAFAHGSGGWRWGAGNLAASVKYRFYDNKRAGLQIAAFPGVTLPTASNGLGSARVSALLPIWAQEDLGQWSVFGGGGYALNLGSGNRDYWEEGLAVSRDFGGGLSGGIELFHHGPDAVDATSETDFGAGAIVPIGGPARILFSGGPALADHRTGYHFYAALGLNF